MADTLSEVRHPPHDFVRIRLDLRALELCLSQLYEPLLVVLDEFGARVRGDHTNRAVEAFALWSKLVVAKRESYLNSVDRLAAAFGRFRERIDEKILRAAIADSRWRLAATSKRSQRDLGIKDLRAFAEKRQEVHFSAHDEIDRLRRYLVAPQKDGVDIVLERMWPGYSWATVVTPPWSPSSQTEEWRQLKSEFRIRERSELLTLLGSDEGELSILEARSEELQSSHWRSWPGEAHPIDIWAIRGVEWTPPTIEQVLHDSEFNEPRTDPERRYRVKGTTGVLNPAELQNRAYRLLRKSIESLDDGTLAPGHSAIRDLISALVELSKPTPLHRYSGIPSWEQCCVIRDLARKAIKETQDTDAKRCFTALYEQACSHNAPLEKGAAALKCARLLVDPLPLGEDDIETAVVRLNAAERIRVAKQRSADTWKERLSASAKAADSSVRSAPETKSLSHGVQTMTVDDVLRCFNEDDEAMFLAAADMEAFGPWSLAKKAVKADSSTWDHRTVGKRIGRWSKWGIVEIPPGLAGDNKNNYRLTSLGHEVEARLNPKKSARRM